MYAFLSAALASLDVSVPAGGRGTNPGEDLVTSPARGKFGTPAPRRRGGAPAMRCCGGQGLERGRFMDQSKDRQDELFTEDDLAREKLGPRGVRGSGDPAVMTPAREKKTPKEGEFDGHVA